MINPMVAGDVATMTQMADSYRQDLRAQFSILTDPAGNPTATPGWPPNVALPGKSTPVGPAVGCWSAGGLIFLLAAVPR